MVGETISIWMDDVMLSAPTVKQAITNGECVITGDFTSEEATQLAARIQAAAAALCPAGELLQLHAAHLGRPGFGRHAAGGHHRLCGHLPADDCHLPAARRGGCYQLAGQVGLCMAAISGFFPFLNSYTMTLPGLAGIVLSIGMGVDANVISASRIREELRNGKTWTAP